MVTFRDIFFFVNIVLYNKELIKESFVGLLLFILQIYQTKAVGSIFILTIPIILLTTIGLNSINKIHKNIKHFIILGIILVIFVLVINFTVSTYPETVLSYKLKNVEGLINSYRYFIDYGMDFVYLLPHSLKVRSIEFINLLDQNIIKLFLGNGLGGTLIETKLQFDNLVSFDFSEDQIETRKFYLLHNTNNIILNYGFLGLFFLIILLIKNKKNPFELSVIYYILFFYGFSLHTYIMLGLLFNTILKRSHVRQS